MDAAREPAMRALVIDEPWIGMILSGSKTWEMRSRRVRIRGPFGLIRKGSGLVVGVSELMDCLEPLCQATYASHERFHRIPADRQEAALGGGWVVPWVLAGTRPLPRPVPYVHPRGAVTWVGLSFPEAEAVLGQAA